MDIRMTSGDELNLPRRFTDETVALVNSPALHKHRRTVCAKLANQLGQKINCLVVSFAPAGRLLEEQKNATGDFPNIKHLGFIKVGEPPVSEANIHKQLSHVGERVSVEVVHPPGNLTLFGIKTVEMLKKLSNEGHPVTVCFDSVTAFLQYATLSEVHDFLDALKNKVENYDAAVHFHIDSGAVDADTMSMLKSSFEEFMHLERAQSGPQLSIKPAQY